MTPATGIYCNVTDVPGYDDIESITFSKGYTIKIVRTLSSQKASDSGVSNSRKSGMHAVQYCRLCTAAATAADILCTLLDLAIARC